MGYAHLFAKSDVALLHDWLQESGELYVDLDRPHSGGSNSSSYFVDRLSGLKEIVSQETHPEVLLHIFREKLYTIRGNMDDALLAAALEQIPDRQWFSILTVVEDPLAPAERIGSGDCHDELRDEFIRLKGRNVRIGRDPFDQPDTGFFETPEDVLVLGFGWFFYS